MSKTLTIFCALVVLLSGCASQKAHWGYSGHEGPENWAKLSTDNFACSGKNQSPINVSGMIEAGLSAIQFNYRPGGHEIINNGHTVQINYTKGSSIKVDGEIFDLLQFHFHAPSENHIKGHSFPLEGHLVHADKEGNLAVVAVMYQEGAANAGLEKAWSMMPIQAGDKHVLSKTANANEFLPKSRDYYRFNGSLTTPPCSEGVRWLVMKESVTASKQQITQFSTALHEPNNRSLQAVNARVILK